MVAVVPRVDPEEAVPKELLAQALKDARVTGAKLARKLHVDAGTVSDWKLGRIPISPSRWMAICTALQQLAPTWVPPAWRIGDPAPEAAKPSAKRDE
jgi:DNA-binding transcriptional regulator YdaS (Cro superfamily)